MTQKISGIDCDGVLIDLDVPWLGRYNKDYNDNLTIEQVTHWDIHEFTKPECGKKMYEYIEDPTIYDDAPPIHGAISGVRILRDLGYEIKFVTHSTKGCSGKKKEWLYGYGILENGSEYFEMEDKSEFPADYLIDDYIKNITTFKMGIGVLFSAPYNKSSIWNPRVNDWNETIRFFQKELL